MQITPTNAISLGRERVSAIETADFVLERSSCRVPSLSILFSTSSSFQSWGSVGDIGVETPEEGEFSGKVSFDVIFSFWKSIVFGAQSFEGAGDNELCMKSHYHFVSTEYFLQRRVVWH
jgi:hypothetical protein